MCRQGYAHGGAAVSDHVRALGRRVQALGKPMDPTAYRPCIAQRGRYRSKCCTPEAPHATPALRELAGELTSPRTP